MAASASSIAPVKQKQKGKPRGKPIQPGQVLNPKGRPPGSRNKLSEDFVLALAEDFETHGKTAIQNVRETKPEVYVRVVADLVPKDFNLNHNASDAFVGLWKMLSGQGSS